MKINKALILKLEHLARLELSEDEAQELMGDLNNILEMVERLQSLDTKEVTPLAYINEDVNVLRADVMKKNWTSEEALKNAPDQDGQYFKVPKVIDI